MGHKNLLVTHTLFRQKDYSEAHAAASAAPAASFLVRNTDIPTRNFRVAGHSDGKGF
jgi:hypothetical protein